MNQFIKLTQASASKESEIIVNVSHIKWVKSNPSTSLNKSTIGIDFVDSKAISIKETPEEIMDLIYGDDTDSTADKKSNSDALKRFG